MVYGGGGGEMEHNINGPEEKIRRLETTSADLGRLSRGSGAIHRSGWSTIQEFALIETGIDSIQMQIETAAEDLRRLMRPDGRTENSTATMADKPKDSAGNIFEPIRARYSLDVETLNRGIGFINVADDDWGYLGFLAP